MAQSINMKVNEKKTQILCIHANNNNHVSSHIETSNNGRISSSKTLKILGFTFSSEPNANEHVTGVINKLYSKLWTLRFLKKGGMSKADLLHVYKQILRPSAEYSHVIYHPLIPEYISDRLEMVQKQAIKIIYGHDINYGLSLIHI